MKAMLRKERNIQMLYTGCVDAPYLALRQYKMQGFICRSVLVTRACDELLVRKCTLSMHARGVCCGGVLRADNNSP
jgi:hypothetical protein